MIDQIAQIAYTANRVFCIALGDDPRPSWASVPMEHRDIIISGVAWAVEHPNSTPRQAHEHCVNDWAARGWKYGPIRNPIAKESPLLIPWDELPREERLKNELFLLIVRAAMLHKGEQQCPPSI